MLNLIFNTDASLGEKFILLCSYALAIMFAIVIHEVAHGYIAMKNGDYTAKFCGRLTLNPVRHFDPLGFIMLAFVGFGWAKPVPINTDNFRKRKVGIFTVSLAGVVANFIVALLCAGLLALYIAVTKGIYESTNTFLILLWEFGFYFLLYSMIINLTLMAFNLLPIFPLDGFRVVEAFAKPDNRYVKFMYRYGIFVLFGALFLGRILGYISPYLDVIGLYINAVTDGVLWIFGKIFGIALV